MAHIPNTLRPSTPDDFELASAVEDRFLVICQTHLRMHGEELDIPMSLAADFKRWREMRVRHKSGDLRNTEAELKSVQTVAQWVLDKNSELRGQEKKVIQWK